MKESERGLAEGKIKGAEHDLGRKLDRAEMRSLLADNTRWNYRKVTAIVAELFPERGDVKPLVALNNMKEFDPACELHRPILLVKAVDPGCTIELQIEDSATGTVVRLTTTDDLAKDMATFEAALLSAFREAWKRAERGG